MKENFIPIDVRDFRIIDQREMLSEAALSRQRVESAKGKPMINRSVSEKRLGLEVSPRKRYKARQKIDRKVQ